MKMEAKARSAAVSATTVFCVMLVGCETAHRVEIQRVNVAVPVECKEPMPARPVMPTEALHPGTDVDQFAQAAMAEIERREGYEGLLRTALAVCTAPIEAGPAKEPLGQRAAWPK